MRNYNTSHSIVFLIIIGACLLPGCGKNDPAINEAQRVTALLTSASWKIQGVMIDGADKTSLFQNLSLAFTDKTFSSTNGNAVWPPTGSWTFTSDQAKAFTRNDGIQVSIQEAGNTTLILSLVWTKTTLGSGRATSIPGTMVFTFGK